MARHEIRMQMGFEDVPNRDEMIFGSFQVKINVTLRINHHGFAFRGEHVRGVRQIQPR